jgi:glycine oxidase
VVRIHAPEVTLQRPTRLIHPRYPSTSRPRKTTVRDWRDRDRVRRYVARQRALHAGAAERRLPVHSGFAEGRIVEIATQCRPTLPDNLPAVRLLARASWRSTACTATAS